MLFYFEHQKIPSASNADSLPHNTVNVPKDRLKLQYTTEVTTFCAMNSQLNCNGLKTIDVAIVTIKQWCERNCIFLHLTNT